MLTSGLAAKCAAMTCRLSRPSATIVVSACIALFALEVRISSQTGFVARDPGVRGGDPGAGEPLDVTPQERYYFDAGKDEFEEAETLDEGIGPTMNLDSCGGCHLQPALGGSSPAVNPQFTFGNTENAIPSFITADGPVREARFIRNADGTPDGGVHALFTISGRPGAEGCALAQPDFETELGKRNVIFRIPTPVFGAGLMEIIPDSVLLANQVADASAKSSLGITGRANFQVAGRAVTGQMNHNGNDGTISRFGWKAQNKSLLIFAGEAYNVEMGITNDLFQTERDETGACQYTTTPNSVSDMTATLPSDAMSAIEKFASFMRMLAPPAPSLDVPGATPASIDAGRNLFTTTGCAFCHTPTLKTGSAKMAALAYKDVNLYSDLLLHDMGVGLSDGISQGEAGPREFRTAPLWGLGQRLFFLHDGRTSDLITAIRAHQSLGSEANVVVSKFVKLTEQQKQDLMNFLRSL